MEVFTMYTDKENINILISLLEEYGITKAVVCPGSRNAPIIHNLYEAPSVTCFAVTDERSAGFYALGMAQHLLEPVVVCVTSGTALLNTLPAVAEAYYQHLPLVVISADRPSAWIDQLDGQTLPQSGALDRFVRRTVSLPEVNNDTERWHCNRLVNEALLETNHQGGGPVHINVPISRPLFNLTIPVLPRQRVIKRLESCPGKDSFFAMADAFKKSDRPMIVIGQTKRGELNISSDALELLSDHAAIVHECLGYPTEIMNESPVFVDQCMDKATTDDGYLPDFILYIGGTLISNKLKNYLRKATKARTFAIDSEGKIHDTFLNQVAVVEAKATDVLADLTAHAPYPPTMFAQKWRHLMAEARKTLQRRPVTFSQSGVVREFFHVLQSRFSGQSPAVQSGNSLSVRIVNDSYSGYVYCNRGVNGIDGSLSTAAGMSVVTDENIYCVIGDLSFFYDSNALWNRNLHGNLRVLLLNNGGGAIFNGLPGLSESPAKNEFIKGEHHTFAEGLCQTHGVDYIPAHDLSEIENAFSRLVGGKSKKAMVAEIMFEQTEIHKLSK